MDSTLHGAGTTELTGLPIDRSPAAIPRTLTGRMAADAPRLDGRAVGQVERRPAVRTTWLVGLASAIASIGLRLLA
ncbi:MAG: hypothetical protein R3349_06615, partial [Geminicoccaceae bacterium]|nr:hypothetical protein [Geminicoccaceae bacterium]